MYDNNKIGVQFLTLYDGIQEVLAIVDTKNGKRYVTNSPDRGNDRVYGDLYTDSELEEILSKQDIYRAKEEKRAEEKRQQEEQERIKAEKLAKELDLYGFTDGKTQIQQAKILDILTKRINYDGIIKTRKQFIFDKVSEGATVEKKDGVISYYGSKWNVKQSKPKTEYRLYNNDGSFWTITKTEFEFALFLMNKN